MGMYNLGQVIKRTRESLGMTQETLCEGICSPETLSRIETGKSTPNRANFQALMERMGKCGERYLPFVHSDDIQLMMEWKRLNQLLAKRQYKELYATLVEYEKNIDMDDKVNRQFVLRMKAISKYYLGEIDVHEKRRMLIEALQCTVPEYHDGMALSNVYSRSEITIMCNIAVSYMEEEELERAMEVLRQVEQYFSVTNMDRDERNVSEILLISNFSQCIGRCGDAKTALEMGERGLRMCIDAKNGSNMVSFLYNTGFEMELLKADEKACKERMIQAFCVAELNGDTRQMKHIEQHWKGKYGGELSF